MYGVKYEQEEIEMEVCAEAIDSGDKSTAKAMSVAYRTALLQALTLPTDEKDPDHDQYEVSSTQKKPAAPESTLSPLWAEIKDDLKYQALGDGKLQFLIDTVGHDVQSPRDLSDSDCEQVIAALRVK
jgi:hypothetical protein